MVLSTVPNAGIPTVLRKRANDAIASAADMKSEDWADLVGGLLKFFSEEADEPVFGEADGADEVMNDNLSDEREAAE